MPRSPPFLAELQSLNWDAKLSKSSSPDLICSMYSTHNHTCVNSYTYFTRHVWHTCAVLTVNELQRLLFGARDVLLSPGGRPARLVVFDQQMRAANFLHLADAVGPRSARPLPLTRVSDVIEVINPTWNTHRDQTAIQHTVFYKQNMTPNLIKKHYDTVSMRITWFYTLFYKKKFKISKIKYDQKTSYKGNFFNRKLIK